METQPYLYRWTELPTGKWYIGSRTRKGCHVDDGYICSSKVVKPLILSNPENWKREILVIGDADQSRYIVEMESFLLGVLDAKNDPMSYNQHNGDGKFSRVGRPTSQAQLEGARKGGLANKGIKRGPKTPAQREAARKVGLANRGRPATSAQIEALRKGGLRPATPTQKDAARKNGLAQKGRPATPAQKAAASLANKGIPKPKFPCQYCGRLIGGKPGLTRHEESCKSKELKKC